MKLKNFMVIAKSLWLKFTALTVSQYAVFSGPYFPTF